MSDRDARKGGREGNFTLPLPCDEMKNTDANSPWRRGRPPPPAPQSPMNEVFCPSSTTCLTKERDIKPHFLSSSRRRGLLRRWNILAEFLIWVRTASSSANTPQENPKCTDGTGPHPQQSRAQNLLTAKHVFSCGQGKRGEGEEDLVNLSCFWHFLSSMNHAAEKIFCPSAGQRAKPTPAAVPRPTRSAALQLVLSFELRPEQSLQLQWPKQLFSNSSFTPITHFNLPLSGRQRWGGGSSNSQWVSQMIHPSFFLAPLRRRGAPSIHRSSPVQQPQQHFFQTPSSGVVIVVSLSPSPSPLSLLRSS